MKIKKYFVVIPPHNKRVRYFRIRLCVIFLTILFFLGGVAGFFIPFNRLTLDEVEVNQKKHLTEQNQKLQTKISSTRRTFLLIKDKMEVLEKTKKHLFRYLSFEKKSKIQDPVLQKVLSEMSLDEIEGYIESTNVYHNSFAELLKGNPEYTEYIPLIKPIDDSCLLSAHFGKMKDPFTGQKKMHYGIDFAAERETPVLAAASGTVEFVEKNDDYWGRRIKINHKFGFSTVYAHLGTVFVSKGRRIKKGEKIATVGLSGLTTGPHLHFEIQRHSIPVDPQRYFFPSIEPMVSAQKE